MRILIDAFGGDNAPDEVIAGTVDAVNEKDGFTAVLVGKADIIEQKLATYKYDKQRIEILPAEDVISCEEEPTLAIRRKPNSSMVVGYKELKENEDATAFVSAGSTGAFLVGATLKLGRIQGVNRPALCPTLPTLIPDKYVFLLDSGANVDCKPINICQFALMGSAYAETLGVKNPTVALLSNGTEEGKGNALNKEAYEMLKNMKTINFVGNMEARDMLSGKYDVIVTDGFAGNVGLKASEGAIKMLLKIIKKEIFSTFKGKLGGLLLKGAFKNIKKTMDYSDKGGALFVGVNKTVVKAHGSATRNSFKGAILQSVDFSELKLANAIKERIEGEPIEINQ